MSQTIATTLPSSPTTISYAQSILSSMQALSGVATDYNIGSQIRTFAESSGSVVEMQSVAAQQQAYYGLTYGSITAYGITPLGAQFATGNVTFSTSLSGSVPASQNVTISAGALLQTAGGIQFQTTAAVTLLSGNTSISAPVAAIVAGTTGNVGSGTITTIVTGLGYPLYVSNAASTTGGAAAESPSNTLARFAADVGSLGLASPYAVANAAIGVSVGSESVLFGSCYEPWIAAGSGAGSGTAGYVLYIDNGLGTASSALIAAVNAKISGSATTSGYRPVGVPYSVQAVTALQSNVSVVGTLLPYIQPSAVETNIQLAVNAYYSAQGIGGTISQSNLSASVANAGEGYFTSLSVILSNTSGTPETSLTASYSQRNILVGLTQNVTAP